MTGNPRKVVRGLVLCILPIVISLVALALVASSEAATLEDYDWLPNQSVADAIEGQDRAWLGRDHLTDDTYIVYTASNLSNPYADNWLVLARFDEENWSFETSYELDGSLVTDRVNDIAVHDGHLLLLLADHRFEDITIMVDDQPAVYSLGAMYHEGNIRGMSVHFLEVTGDRITVLAVCYWVNSPWGGNGMTVRLELITINRTDSSLERREILKTTQEDMTSEKDFVVRDGVLHYCYAGYVQDDYHTYYYMFRYDLGSGTSEGPTLIYDEEHLAGYYFQVFVDSEGDYHLKLTDQKPKMVKVNMTGVVLDTLQLGEHVPEGPGNGPELMVMNGSDHLYWFYSNDHLNSLRVLDIDPDYESELAPREQYNGTIKSLGLVAAVTSGDRVVAVWTARTDEGDRLRFTCQTPPIPDMAVDNGIFRLGVTNRVHEPVGIGFSVENLGRGDCTGLRVVVEWLDGSNGMHHTLATIDSDAVVGPGGSVRFEVNCSLPSGSQLILIRVERVQPNEFNLLNNLFQTHILVPNNAPVLNVTAPEDCTTVDGLLEVNGSTLDLDGPEDVLTQLICPGGIVKTLEGTGEWSLAIDVSSVPSGDYVLRVHATDGIATTSVVSLRVRIDHGADCLWIESYSPRGDVELLVGEDQAFNVKAIDRFSRPLAWAWYLDGDPLGEAGQDLHYLATTPGTYCLRVDVTNDRHTVSQSWDISVRDPITPSLVRLTPAEGISIGKGEVVKFAAELVNPDGVPCSMAWVIDQGSHWDTPSLERSMSFPDSGDHTVSLFVFHPAGHSSIDWNVSVMNAAPSLVSRSPEKPIVHIEQDETLDFTVVAKDPDGDPLTFLWSWTKGEVVEGGATETSESLRLSCPCVDEEPYTISVVVSDGEDELRVEWTVEPDPPEPPVNLPPVLEGRTPQDGNITLREEAVVYFSVLANDPEGDQLTFTWSSSKLQLDALNASGHQVLCPCEERGEYTVFVDISDGEHILRVEWTLETDPRPEPAEMMNVDVPWALMAAILVVVVMATAAYIYWDR